MPVTPIAEAKLYAALQPFRTKPALFLSAVQTKIDATETAQADVTPSEDSPLLRMAAAFLPVSLLTGGKGSTRALQVEPLALPYKLLGYVSLPAIHLFILLGTAIFGTAWIRRVQRENTPDDLDQSETIHAAGQWWRQHKWPAGLFYALVILLPGYGPTWLLFLFLLISMGVLLLMLTALAKQGLGNRLVMGLSCLMGLGLLGQVLSSMPGIGDSNIHFLDQRLLGVVFYVGVLVVELLIFRHIIAHRGKAIAWTAFVFSTILVVGLSCWFAKPTFFPLTPAQIRQHVEDFDEAQYSSASWRSWEMVATWARRSGFEPDLTKPRQLLAMEIAGEQNPFVLGSAFRTGLVAAEQVTQLPKFENGLSELLGVRQNQRRQPGRIHSIAQRDWVLRAAVEQNLLSDQDCDYLERRLLATWDALEKHPSLEDALRVTQLLELLGRPLESDRQQAQVHEWLRYFHSKQGGGFQLAGGFKLYAKSRTGDLRATWYAIELMQRFGIPENLDMNWVRSFLKPVSMGRSGDRRYLAAVLRSEVQQLPGIHRPTWLEYLSAERNFFAAMLLVAMCIYATSSSPLPALAKQEN